MSFLPLLGVVVGVGAGVEDLMVDPILWGVEPEQAGVEPEQAGVEPEQAGVVVEVELEWLLQVGQ